MSPHKFVVGLAPGLTALVTRIGPEAWGVVLAFDNLECAGGALYLEGRGIVSKVGPTVNYAEWRQLGRSVSAEVERARGAGLE